MTMSIAMSIAITRYPFFTSMTMRIAMNILITKYLFWEKCMLAWMSAYTPFLDVTQFSHF